MRSVAGEDMGRIIDIIVDKDGRPRAAIIDFGGFLGVGSRKIAVDWRALHFSADNKPGRAVLQLNRNQVRVSPEYKPGDPIVVLGPPPAPLLPPPRRRLRSAAPPVAAPAPPPVSAAPSPAPAPTPTRPRRAPHRQMTRPRPAQRRLLAHRDRDLPRAEMRPDPRQDPARDPVRERAGGSAGRRREKPAPSLASTRGLDAFTFCVANLQTASGRSWRCTSPRRAGPSPISASC